MFMYVGLFNHPKSKCRIKATFWIILGFLTSTTLFSALTSCIVYILRGDVNFKGIFSYYTTIHNTQTITGYQL